MRRMFGMKERARAIGATGFGLLLFQCASSVSAFTSDVPAAQTDAKVSEYSDSEQMAWCMDLEDSAQAAYSEDDYHNVVCTLTGKVLAALNPLFKCESLRSDCLTDPQTALGENYVPYSAAIGDISAICQNNADGCMATHAEIVECFEASNEVIGKLRHANCDSDIEALNAELQMRPPECDTVAEKCPNLFAGLGRQ